MVNFYIVKVFGLATLAFLLAMALTPFLSHFLYKYRLGKGIRDAQQAPIFAKLHQKKSGTPTIGGILVWGTTLFLILLFFNLAGIFEGIFGRLNFLSRS